MYFDPFIVGALGAWDRANELIINHLKIGHNCCRLMRKLMVSDAFRWNRDIYVEHLTDYGSTTRTQAVTRVARDVANRVFIRTTQTNGKH